MFAITAIAHYIELIFHALRTYNQCVTMRVEHIEHILVNIHCRGVFRLIIT
jgi:hypothetical protein